MKTMTKQKAIEVLKAHGWTATEQTACINGVSVLKGSSFFEMLGNFDFYCAKAVFEWLGY